MKKLLIFSLVLGMMLAAGGIVVAAGMENGLSAKVMPSGAEIEAPQQIIDSAPVIERVIALTPNLWDKLSYWLQGCKSVRKISDGAAYQCSAKAAEKLIASGKAIEDKRYYIMDADANILINADDVWDMGYTGEGVIVAVLDTGIDTDHPELIDNIAGGQSFVSYTTSYKDDHGHGTHVSGIITASGVDEYAKGVAPDTGIWTGKVLDSSGSGWSSDIAAAIEHVVYYTDADVISLSLGGGNFAGADCDADYLAGKVNWAVDNGVAVVAASGNDKFFVSSPACASGAIAVGAVDKTGLMASWSNFGPSLDIVAPGVSIYSSIINGGYASWSGTSMATPHVAGTIALMLEANPGLTVEDVKTALYETATPINDNSVCYGVVRQAGPNYFIGVVPCSSDNYGAGIVNAYGAVNYVTPVGPENYCGDGYCGGLDLGEDCKTCSVDCPSRTTGKLTNRYCCGNNFCESAEKILGNCPIDCPID